VLIIVFHYCGARYIVDCQQVENQNLTLKTV